MTNTRTPSPTAQTAPTAPTAPPAPLPLGLARSGGGPGWRAASAAVIGRDHVLVGRNGQDHAVATTGGGWAVASVSDGCGSARGSEVGARVSAIVAARQASSALAADGTQTVALEAVARDVGREVKRVLREVARQVASGDAAAFAVVHLTATLLVGITRGEEALVFGWGDGLVRIDTRVMTIDEGGHPRYLARDLGSDEPAPFSLLLRADRAPSIAVATDGFDERVLAELPVASSAALLRWMRIRARSGDFADDGAVALLAGPASSSPAVGGSAAGAERES